MGLNSLKYKTFVLFILLGATLAFSATIKGYVRCHGNKILLDKALVTIETKKDSLFSEQTLSDRDGYFEFRHVPEGIYKIAGMRDGFYSNCLFDFYISDEGVYDVNIRLIRNKSGSKDLGYCFMIGGIEVSVEEENVVPEEIVTTRKIDSGEIDHLQATNLGDVLTLVPGVEKSGQLGLEKAQNVGLRKVRRSDQRLSGFDSFGTSVIVDGNEISGDAKMTGYVSGSASQSGVDLRSIPADNIESVEVITGVASVEYGNYADGVVKVNTKKGNIDSRIKAKINPKTKGFSYSGGNKLGLSTLNYHMNYSYSERDLRKIGDEYQRLYGSLFLTREYKEKHFTTEYGATATRIFDDEEPNDAYRMQNTSHNYSISGKYKAKYEPKKNVKYDLFLGMDMKNTDEVKQRLVYDQVFLPVDSDVSSIDTGYCSIITVRDTVFFPGTDSIDFVDSSLMVYPYNATVSQKGREWDYSFKLKRRSQHTWGKTKNKLLFGLETDFEQNTGDGVLLDSLFNYYGVASTKRSYSFDIYPGNLKISLYGEDQMSFNLLGRKTQVLMGLRYDVINPEGLDLGKEGDGFHFLNAKQGEFLSPRFNIRYYLSDKLTFRAGLGQSVKSVSLTQIYRTPKHISYVDYINDSTAVETEKILYRVNENLKSYTTMKEEISLDWKMNDKMGLSLTGYYTETNDRPQGVTYPDGYEENPDTVNQLFTYSLYENTGWDKSYGLELAFRTKRIKNIKYALNATYRYNEYGSNAPRYDADYAANSSYELWYDYYTAWKHKLILDGRVSYISQRFGVWITMDVQFIPFYQKQKVYNSNSYLEYNDNGDPYLQYQGMTYWYEAELYTYTHQWLFNLRISKSLGQHAEISMYINNLFDDRAVYSNPYSDFEYELNSPIYYGLEMSIQL